MSKKTLSEIPAFKKWVNFFKDKTIEEIEELSYPDYSKDDEVSRVAKIFMDLAMTEEERVKAEQRENALRLYKTEKKINYNIGYIGGALSRDASFEEIAKKLDMSVYEVERYYKEYNEEIMKIVNECKDETKKIAKSLKKDGMNSELISKYTGLSAEEIEKI